MTTMSLIEKISVAVNLVMALKISLFVFTNSRFLSTYLFPLKMDPNSARQKVMRYYKEEDPKEIDPDKENWNESKSLLDNILADLQLDNNFN